MIFYCCDGIHQILICREVLCWLSFYFISRNTLDYQLLQQFQECQGLPVSSPALLPVMVIHPPCLNVVCHPPASALLESCQPTDTSDPYQHLLLLISSTEDSWAFQVALVVKNLPAKAGDVRGQGQIPGSGRSPGGRHGNPLHSSCLENPMDRGAWRATVHRTAQSRTQLKQLSLYACIEDVLHFSAKSLPLSLLVYFYLFNKWSYL